MCDYRKLSFTAYEGTGAVGWQTEDSEVLPPHASGKQGHQLGLTKEGEGGL